MTNDLETTLDQISAAIRSAFNAHEGEWRVKIANYEREVQRLRSENMSLRKMHDEMNAGKHEQEMQGLRNENMSLRNMYDEMTEKYTRVKRALDKFLRRRKSEPAGDIGQMASMFMESTSTFEDAATAAMLVRSNAKRVKAESAIPDRNKNVDDHPKRTPLVNRVTSVVLNHDDELSKATEPSLSPQLGDHHGASSTIKDNPSTLCDNRAAECDLVDVSQVMMKTAPIIPGRNRINDKPQPARASNEFNTSRSGVAPTELQGHDCSQCGGFYEHIGIERAPSNCNKTLVDAVSRHRSTRKRPDTPQGYWDINFPETQNSF